MTKKRKLDYVPIICIVMALTVPVVMFLGYLDAQQNKKENIIQELEQCTRETIFYIGKCDGYQDATQNFIKELGQPTPTPRADIAELKRKYRLDQE